MGGRSLWQCGHCPFGSRQDEFSWWTGLSGARGPHLALRQITQARRRSGALAPGTFEFDPLLISK